MVCWERTFDQRGRNRGGGGLGGSQVVRSGAILRQIGGEFYLAANRVDARPQSTWVGLLAKTALTGIQIRGSASHKSGAVQNRQGKSGQLETRTRQRSRRRAGGRSRASEFESRGDEKATRRVGAGNGRKRSGSGSDYEKGWNSGVLIFGGGGGVAGCGGFVRRDFQTGRAIEFRGVQICVEGKGEGNLDRRCEGRWRGSLTLNGWEGRSTNVDGNVGEFERSCERGIDRTVRGRRTRD